MSKKCGYLGSFKLNKNRTTHDSLAMKVFSKGKILKKLHPLYCTYINLFQLL
ncbi:uncharacterized protein DS421_14g465160 [Arachis hypogaea]|nr:uncharacterized protein DS421_14g465160 [Arachis hypogaea]